MQLCCNSRQSQKKLQRYSGDKSLKKTQIYAIIKNIKEGKTTTDQRKLNGRRKVRSLGPTSRKISV
jgi:hypothetical protein